MEPLQLVFDALRQSIVETEGGAQVNWQFLFAAAAYNLVRLRNLRQQAV